MEPRKLVEYKEALSLEQYILKGKTVRTAELIPIQQRDLKAPQRIYALNIMPGLGFSFLEDFHLTFSR